MKNLTISISVDIRVPDDTTAYKIADHLFVALRGVKRDLPEELGKITDIGVSDPEVLQEA